MRHNSTFRRKRALAGIASAVILCAAPGAAAALPAQSWLVLSDIHLNPLDRSSQPNGTGFDTNMALFLSAVAQMKRSVPDPAVVLLPGDLLMHRFAQHVHPADGTPQDVALRAMRAIAQTLDNAFPKAQFAITLGNNDVPCGDYASAEGSRYQSAVARIWSPLVNRRGASPRFAASFATRGYYTATLPAPRLRLLVLDTVLLSRVYRGNCGPPDSDASADELQWLASTLATGAGERSVVMMHVPPGYDVYSTDYVYGLALWPFLRPDADRKLIAALSDPDNGVAFAVAGHTHRFDFRIAGGVPVVVFGSLSPIYASNPTFYALRVSANGSLLNIEIHPYDEARRIWLTASNFDDLWGVSRVDGRSLSALHGKLADEPQARSSWDRQAAGWPSDPGDATGTWRSSWKLPWCAQNLLVPDFAQCAGIKARGFIALGLGLCIVGAAFSAALVFRRFRLAGRRASTRYRARS